MEIGHLPNLRWFNCRENEIETIPKELCDCRLLEELIVSHNKLKSLPGSFSKVKVLHASNNEVEEWAVVRDEKEKGRIVTGEGVKEKDKRKGEQSADIEKHLCYCKWL